MNHRNNSQNQTQQTFSKSASKKQVMPNYQSPNILFGVKLQEAQSQQQLPMANQIFQN